MLYIVKAGVRNQITGKISEIKQGEVMSQVTVSAGEVEITSVMTSDSLAEAGFKNGDTVAALIKAINVVLIK